MIDKNAHGRERLPSTVEGWVRRYASDFGFVPVRGAPPTEFAPGDRAKVDLMRKRFESGQPIHVVGDRTLHAWCEDYAEEPLGVRFAGNAMCGAEFSLCGNYRYRLWRRWDDDPRKPVPAFIGLNPSTADEKELDPTLRRIKGFCLKEGCAGFEMLNLFAYRSTDPSALLDVGDPIGPGNDRAINLVCRRVSYVVCCWGNGGDIAYRSARVMWALSKCKELPRKNIHCFGLTKLRDSKLSPGRMVGQPRHPLYLAKDSVTIQLPFEQMDINDDDQILEDGDGVGEVEDGTGFELR